MFYIALLYSLEIENSLPLGLKTKLLTIEWGRCGLTEICAEVSTNCSWPCTVWHGSPKDEYYLGLHYVRSMVSKIKEDSGAPHWGVGQTAPRCLYFIFNNIVGEAIPWQKLLEGKLVILSKFKGTYPMFYILETLYIFNIW